VVRFVKSRDKYRGFAFMPQTTRPSQDKSGEEKETIAFWEGDQLLEGSTAVLRALYWLGWPWKVLYAFIVVPRPWRDAVYRFIARRRTRWAGRREQCFLPGEEKEEK